MIAIFKIDEKFGELKLAAKLRYFKMISYGFFDFFICLFSSQRAFCPVESTL